MAKQTLQAVIEGTLMAALAAALTMAVPTVEWIDLSLGIIPIVLVSLRRGWKIGVYAGLLWGILPVLFGRAEILTVWQGILEYPVASMSVGLAGIWASRFHAALRANRPVFHWIMVACLTGVGVKYLIHFYAGIVFWGAYVQWGLGPVAYSAVVNGSSFVLNMVISTTVLEILLRHLPHLGGSIPDKTNNRR
ncbi:energy-coupled thiamine transporter ThiT [Ligilactobacillus sp. LYQ60]|uniref:energy-coupled thiamine transporter ThiT n=1 Tax=unclassified Ligilactobacillus TaxID=2767920 RepID=UPI0038549423